MHPFLNRSLAAAALCIATACGRHSASMSSSPVASDYSPAISGAVARLRAATDKYHSLDSAVAVGYPAAVPECLVHAEHGAMGYHHVNRNYVDNKVEIEKPEILLYERLGDGSYRLNGVEFIVPFRTWPRDSVPPTLMGMKMHREDNLKIWYTHVWAWTKNPEGLFANFNPEVQCRNGTGKVYAPTIDPSPPA